MLIIFLFYRFAKQFFLLSSFVLENIVGVKFVLSGDIPSDPVCFFLLCCFVFCFFVFLFFVFIYFKFFLLIDFVVFNPHSFSSLLQQNESLILLSNHRTRTDWIFLWSLFVYRFNPSHMKIALKYPLKVPSSLFPPPLSLLPSLIHLFCFFAFCLFCFLQYAPGFGWACQMFSFLFLKRNWNEDEGFSSPFLSPPTPINPPLPSPPLPSKRKHHFFVIRVGKEKISLPIDVFC